MTKQTTTKKQAIYICQGECDARLTKEGWQKHPTKTCQAKWCSHYGKPFVKRVGGLDRNKASGRNTVI